MTATQQTRRGNGRNNVEELRPIRNLVPPHDLDAEAAVISACMLDEGAYDACAGMGLTPETFYSAANRAIYDAVVYLKETSEACDVVMVANRLRDTEKLNMVGGTPYLVQMTDAVPAVTNIASYARVVRDKWRLRHVIATMRAHAAAGYAELESGVQEYLDNVEHDVAEIARAFDASRGMRTIGAAGAAAMDRIVDARADGDTQVLAGVPFGYERVDNLTKGMMGSDLIIVAARPGMGKTAFALGVALNNAAPEPHHPDDDDAPPRMSVAFFSLEMADEQLALRGIAHNQRLNAQRLRAFEVAGKEWQQFVDGVAWEQKVAIHIDDTPRLSHADIRSRARRLAAELERSGKPRLGLIIVDYLQIMGGVQRYNQNREELVADNARGLKALAKELDVPVMALAQLNRGVENRSAKDKRPMLSDLRESGAIEQEADLVAFLYRDEYYFPDTPDAGVAEFIVAKQRSGPTRTTKLRFTPEYTRFDNLADYDDDFEDVADETY
jgi:replicative DNA helicase